MKPLQDYVILQEVKPETKSKSGIELGGEVEESNIGIVEGIGPKVDIGIKEGDKVLLKRYGVDEMDGKLISKQENIVAIL